MNKIDKIIKDNKLVIEEKEFKEYDKNNNIIHHKNSDGYEYWKEFDKNNNIIHHKDSDGYEYWKEYDKNNNEIKTLKLSKGKYYLNGELLKEGEMK